MNNIDKKKPQYREQNGNQPRKRSLLLRFIVFIAWVVGIGLILSLFACTPVNDPVSRSKSINSQTVSKPIAVESLEDLLIKMIKATNRPLLITGYSKGE